MFDMQEIGRRIAALRKAADMTQMELADRLDISFQAVSNWERGNTMPDIAKLPELAELFGVSIDALLGAKNRAVEAAAEPSPPKEAVDVQTLLEAAPVLKPTQLRSMSENAAGLRWEDIAALAPFVDGETLELLAERCAETPDHADLTILAPFLRRKTMDRLVNLCIGEGRRGTAAFLADIVPFVSRDSAAGLVKLLDETVGFLDVAMLAPFLSREEVDELVCRCLQNGEAVDGAALMDLAPFVARHRLQEMIPLLLPDACDIETITAVAPFLDAQTLKELLKRL